MSSVKLATYSFFNIQLLIRFHFLIRIYFIIEKQV